LFEDSIGASSMQRREQLLKEEPALSSRMSAEKRGSAEVRKSGGGNGEIITRSSAFPHFRTSRLPRLDGEFYN